MKLLRQQRIKEAAPRSKSRRTSNHLHFHTGFGSGANWTGRSGSDSTTDRRVSLAGEESCNELISVSWDMKSKHRLSCCRYSQLTPDSFSLGRTHSTAIRAASPGASGLGGKPVFVDTHLGGRKAAGKIRSTRLPCPFRRNCTQLAYIACGRLWSPWQLPPKSKNSERVATYVTMEIFVQEAACSCTRSPSCTVT